MTKIEVEAKTIFDGELWEAGSGTLVISIGKKIKDFYGYNKGDRLTIAIINHLPGKLVPEEIKEVKEVKKFDNRDKKFRIS